MHPGFHTRLFRKAKPTFIISLTILAPLLPRLTTPTTMSPMHWTPLHRTRIAARTAPNCGGVEAVERSCASATQCSGEDGGMERAAGVVAAGATQVPGSENKRNSSRDDGRLRGKERARSVGALSVQRRYRQANRVRPLVSLCWACHASRWPLPPSSPPARSPSCCWPSLCSPSLCFVMSCGGCCRRRHAHRHCVRYCYALSCFAVAVSAVIGPRHRCAFAMTIVPTA